MQNLVRKILIVSDVTNKPKFLYLDQMPKLAKGFIRLGHDVRQLSYCGLLSQLSHFKSRSLSSYFFKRKVDETLCRYAKHYDPHIIFIGFAKYFDAATVRLLRQAAPSAVFVGFDGDPWPGKNAGRIETARELDILLATNNGSFLEEYRQAGVKKCVFMPNCCDPDIEYRYSVNEGWRSDILWTGKVQHKAGLNTGETLRQDVLGVLADHPRTKLYGCMGRPEVEGLDYLHAISGAKIGISINAINSIPLYHSDRFTHYTACGTMILAKRVPNTDLLMEDKKYVAYFDTPQECLELANWYLAHEDERQKVADAGMERCHVHFNSVKVAGYILELVEKGHYKAPWGSF